MPHRRSTPLSQHYIFRFWLPLAIMWLMMAFELPILAGVIARMDAPKQQLAAFGITFSLALLIESPIIMLLVASVALARGKQSYGQLLRFTTLLSAVLTVFHLIVALTPLYGTFVGVVIGAPAELVEPSRRAFLVMFPWTAAVAYRRLWQGVMIRFGMTDLVGLTTVIRLTASVIVAVGGLLWGTLPGATLAGVALSVGVIAGALAALYFSRPLIAQQFSGAEPASSQISLRSLLDFYIPLALTNTINFIGRPLLTFGLSRALLPLESLALWPVLMSLAFIFRSVGFAYQEVVVALLEDEATHRALKRFAITLATISSGLFLLLAATPLNDIWYGRISGLSPDLVALSRPSTLILSLLAACAVFIAWQRGILVQLRRTRLITLAVAVNVSVLVGSMLLGMRFLAVPGIYLAAGATMLAFLSETLFLTWQTGSVREHLAPVGVSV